VKSSKKDYIEFYTGYFCPYAQMAWIALNEKMSKTDEEDRIEVVVYEGLEIKGDGYKIHPKLEALGQTGIPTLNHIYKGKNRVIYGSTACIHYIDENFGPKNTLIPSKETDSFDRKKTLLGERWVHEKITWAFYPMLLFQDWEKQMKCKDKMTNDIKTMINFCQLPFYAGLNFTIADVAMAPYMARLHVLDHFRNYTVPKDNDTWKFHEWMENVMKHPSVKETI
jgi:glutathione S-transferase